MAARDQTNLIGAVTGKAFVRPGLQYLAANKSNAKARLLSFVAGQTAAFQLELTNQNLRVRNGATDALVTRAAVTAAVTNGDFSSGTGWTLASMSGQTSSISGGFLLLSARGKGAEASCYRAVTINEIGTEHAFRIVVARGPVLFRCGTSAGAQDVIAEVELRAGTYSLAFTPAGATVYPRFSSSLAVQKIVDSISIEAAGVMDLPTNWLLADLGLIRHDQSLDVMFLAARGYKQQRIERHGDTSWGICAYDADDGPFLVGRTAQVKLTPGALEGNTTLTASAAFFTANHVGALFYLGHQGQRLDTYLAGSNQFTDTIEITGVNETNYNDRDWTYTLAGTWVGTGRVQRSFDSKDAGFQAFRYAQASATIDVTANGTNIDDDNEDNAITWYRFGFEDATYTSGELHFTAQYGGGEGFGICRVVGFTSSTQVDVEVLKPFAGNYATENWREGEWSAAQQFPSSVMFTEGRLVWAGDDKVWASVSDEFESFDETVVGDSAPLLRSIAVGGRNLVQWMLNLSSAIVGTDSRMMTVRSNSLGDTLTPTNFNVVPLSKVGAAAVSAITLADNRGMFVERAGVSLFEISYAPYPVSSYIATKFSELNAEILMDGILEMASSLIPDQRLWLVTDGGDAVCVTYNNAEKVVCFSPIATATGDIIESICVLPGTEQDRVYMSVKRTVNGATVRYTEKLALDTEVTPATVCKVMDSFVSGTGAHSATINLPHLVARTDVYAWVDGAPVETSSGVPTAFTPDGSGNITLPNAPTQGYCVGVGYPWVYESCRLEYGMPNATPVFNVKSIKGIALMLADYVRSGILIRTRNADGTLSATAPLDKRVRGKVVSNVVIGRGIDEGGLVPIPGDATLDTRIVIEGSSPYPASILAVVIAMENYGG